MKGASSSTSSGGAHGSSFGRVHTLPDWYDGPRGGLADYRGEPHFFQSLFLDLAGDPDFYLLWPAASDEVALALEEWDIWLRWVAAAAVGDAPEESHPALPKDRARFERIRDRVALAYGRWPEHGRFATAVWRSDPSRPGSAATYGGALVEWSVVECRTDIARLRGIAGGP